MCCSESSFSKGCLKFYLSIKISLEISCMQMYLFQFENNNSTRPLICSWIIFPYYSSFKSLFIINTNILGTLSLSLSLFFFLSYFRQGLIIYKSREICSTPSSRSPLWFTVIRMRGRAGCRRRTRSARIAWCPCYS